MPCLKFLVFTALLSRCSSNLKSTNQSHPRPLREYIGEFNIQTGQMIEGDLPLKAQKLVQEWLALYKNQLQTMWDSQVIEKLPPLE